MFERHEFVVIVQFHLVSMLIRLGQQVPQVHSAALVLIEPLDSLFSNHMLLRVVWYSLLNILDNRDTPNTCSRLISDHVLPRGRLTCISICCCCCRFKT
jgi:hypothetical protein